MPTPGAPQAALSATQSGEHPHAGLPHSKVGRWAPYARSGGLARLARKDTETGEPLEALADVGLTLLDVSDHPHPAGGLDIGRPLTALIAQNMTALNTYQSDRAAERRQSRRNFAR
ncbi:hypothetical protein AB0F17_28535 [Nonomuraea sp. NPDC026600]|uniref:hypothetical protein n=1 Tax=Nonomuraea sp. NPDC026600 TaxID=3155363 RepID=UPI0033E399B8